MLTEKLMKSVALFLASAVFLTGCARLKGNTVYEYVPSLPGGTIAVKAQMTEFQDLRPEWDRKQTRDVEPVATKLTRKIYDDFKGSEVFTSIFTGKDASPDVIIKGRIYNFYWKNRYKWYAFVPYLNLILLFGVPYGQFKGEVKLVMDVVSARTGQVIASYEESALREDTYNAYRVLGGYLGGTETSEALRVNVENIKQRMLNDKATSLAGV